MKEMNDRPQISKSRLVTGGLVIVVGFLSPLLIPLITATTWSVGLKSAISGLLALGIPEVFMIIGVAILGKDGYEFLKKKIFGLLKYVAPPDEVSPIRYRLGLIMFCIPLFLGWAGPYLAHIIPSLRGLSLYWFMLGDLVFISSLFLLGGNFWDKLYGLFLYDAKINFEPKK